MKIELGEGIKIIKREIWFITKGEDGYDINIEPSFKKGFIRGLKQAVLLLTEFQKTRREYP